MTTLHLKLHMYAQMNNKIKWDWLSWRTRFYGAIVYCILLSVLWKCFFVLFYKVFHIFRLRLFTRDYVCILISKVMEIEPLSIRSKMSKAFEFKAQHFRVYYRSFHFRYFQINIFVFILPRNIATKYATEIIVAITC